MELANVEKVYTGTAHKCMCGCAGKYSYASAHSTTDYDNVSDRSVKIIFNKVNKNPNKIVEGNIMYVEVGNRILAVYGK